MSCDDGLLQVSRLLHEIKLQGTQQNRFPAALVTWARERMLDWLETGHGKPRLRVLLRVDDMHLDAALAWLDEMPGEYAETPNL